MTIVGAVIQVAFVFVAVSAFVFALARLIVIGVTWCVGLPMRVRRRHWKRKGGRCVNCGYVLLAYQPRCPECGCAPGQFGAA